MVNSAFFRNFSDETIEHNEKFPLLSKEKKIIKNFTENMYDIIIFFNNYAYSKNLRKRKKIQLKMLQVYISTS